RLTGGSAHECVLFMHMRRCGDVNRINIRIVDECFGIVVPFGDAMPFSVILCQSAITPHHRDQFRAISFLKTRPAFNLGDIADTDNAPSYNTCHSLILVKLAYKLLWDSDGQ